MAAKPRPRRRLQAPRRRKTTAGPRRKTRRGSTATPRRRKVRKRSYRRPVLAVVLLGLLAIAGWFLAERWGFGEAMEARPVAAAETKPSLAKSTLAKPAAKPVAKPAPTTAWPPPAPPAPPLASVAPPPPAPLPAWQANAVKVAVPPGQPRLAIVLDDVGPARGAALKAIALPGPLTLAFLPYADRLPELTGKARAAGHELLVHMPWEPADLANNNPGPNALLTSLPLEEIRARLRWSLKRFDGFVGINNHMGSSFSTYAPGLAVVMEELRAAGLLFLDSRTTGRSLAESAARDAGVPTTGRDVFLDNVEDPVAIRAQLAEVERIARQRGWAIAIGHPHPATLAVLAEWLPAAQARGIALVPISNLVKPGAGAQQAADLPGPQ